MSGFWKRMFRDEGVPRDKANVIVNMNGDNREYVAVGAESLTSTPHREARHVDVSPALGLAPMNVSTRSFYNELKEVDPRIIGVSIEADRIKICVEFSERKWVNDSRTNQQILAVLARRAGFAEIRAHYHQVTHQEWEDGFQRIVTRGVAEGAITTEDAKHFR